ncbi:MAG: CHAT domain-containing protein, partial [Candidatus Brocadiia bacterium]
MDPNPLEHHHQGEEAEQVRVLLLAACPADTDSLRLDEEAREIRAAVRGSGHSHALHIETRTAVQPDDVLQSLNEVKPHIVHFSGHGSAASGIVLLDLYDRPSTVSTAALRELFRTLKDDIRLVVLNACSSQEQAQAIAENIDCVIGMRSSIDDDAAIIFAASLYRAIGFGQSIQGSFNQGITSLLLHSAGHEEVPKLFVRNGADAERIHLVGAVRAESSGPGTARDRKEKIRTDICLIGSVASGHPVLCVSVLNVGQTPIFMESVSLVRQVDQPLCVGGISAHEECRRIPLNSEGQTQEPVSPGEKRRFILPSNAMPTAEKEAREGGPDAVWVEVRSHLGQIATIPGKQVLPYLVRPTSKTVPPAEPAADPLQLLLVGDWVLTYTHPGKPSGE